MLGVYKDGDKCVLTEEANKFNERVGGRLNELLCQYVLNLNRVCLFFFEMGNDIVPQYEMLSVTQVSLDFLESRPNTVTILVI